MQISQIRDGTKFIFTRDAKEAIQHIRRIDLMIKIGENNNNFAEAMCLCDGIILNVSLTDEIIMVNV